MDKKTVWERRVEALACAISANFIIDYVFLTILAISKPCREMKINGRCSTKFQTEYPGIINSEMALNTPMIKPTKLVTPRTYPLTLG